jgi:hypothetical protein
MLRAQRAVKLLQSDVSRAAAMLAENDLKPLFPHAMTMYRREGRNP